MCVPSKQTGISVKHNILWSLGDTRGLSRKPLGRDSHLEPRADSHLLVTAAVSSARAHPLGASSEQFSHLVASEHPGTSVCTRVLGRRLASRGHALQGKSYTPSR